MNIDVTFRKVDTTQAIKRYAEDKVARLQRLLRQPMKAKITLSLEKLRHVAEVRLSSGSEHIEAREVSPDLYASIDGVIDKLERQIRSDKGAERTRRRGGETVRGGGALEVLASADAPASKKTVKKVAKKTVKKPAAPATGKSVTKVVKKSSRSAAR